MNYTVATVFIASFVVFLTEVKADAPPTNGIIAGDKAEQQVPLAAYWFRDHYYVCTKAESQLLAEPRWNPESDEPPLSPRSALVIAEKYARSEVTNSDAFRLEQIVLKEWAGRWFYVVTLDARIPVYFPYWEPIDIPVLMDGTIAEREERVLDSKKQKYVPVSGQNDKH